MDFLTYGRSQKSCVLNWRWVISCIFYGFCFFSLELDALFIVCFHTNVDKVHPSWSPLMDDCRLLLRKIPYMEVKHVFKEGIDALMHCLF